MSSKARTYKKSLGIFSQINDAFPFQMHLNGISAKKGKVFRQSGGMVRSSDARPLAAVTKGAGNRLADGFGGAVQGSVVATSVDGPCLAHNPQLAATCCHGWSARCRRLICPRWLCLAPNGWPRRVGFRRSGPETV